MADDLSQAYPGFLKMKLYEFNYIRYAPFFNCSLQFEGDDQDDVLINV